MNFQSMKFHKFRYENSVGNFSTAFGVLILNSKYNLRTGSQHEISAQLLTFIVLLFVLLVKLPHQMWNWEKSYKR